MKSQVYDSNGKEKGIMELPKLFETKIREDIVQKYFEADKFVSPYAPKRGAGMRQSAAGTISHKRHDWKGHYGKGISRVSRKTMWRRGTQFFWVAANAPGTRQGRKAHPPRGIGREKKINKKEIKLAFDSAFAATASPSYALKRYSTLERIDAIPFVIESLPQKTKDLIEMIKNILKENYKLAIKQKSTRAGKGKQRGRKHKSNAGLLIVTSTKEEHRVKGFDTKNINEVLISDLYPLGRLTFYTKSAIEELEDKK
ncbi:50S ribosomal protein L4 [Candidatus Pacearchaeota archaeon]|nr:50S ribosomal protein L4 [Candidatus Pacearchaeota archaeon]